MIAALAPAKPKPLTAEDLMKMDSEGVRGELVQGAFCEIMGSGFRHAAIAGRFARHLGNFVEPRGLGLVGGADGGVRLERDPDTVRIPDAMFIPANRLPPYDDLDLYFESIPAIAAYRGRFRNSYFWRRWQRLGDAGLTNGARYPKSGINSSQRIPSPFMGEG